MAEKFAATTHPSPAHRELHMNADQVEKLHHQQRAPVPYSLNGKAKLAIDSGLFVLATLTAFTLRFDGVVPDTGPVLLALAVSLPLKILADVALGLPQRSWSSLTFRDLGGLLALALVIAVPGTLLLVVFGAGVGIPRSIAVLDATLTFFLLAGVRALVRYRHEQTVAAIIGPDFRKRVLVIGAGEAGALVVRELLKHPETGIKPVAFLDDDPLKYGQRVSTVPVLGPVALAKDVILKQEIDEVLIAMPSKGGRTVRNVIEQVRQARPGMAYKTVPGIYELLSVMVDVRRIREVDIDDLLGREPVKLDTDAILDYLSGKRVMITGAGGSIGSELVRQICRFNPAELILFGHGENSIYALERELDRDWPAIKYHGVIGAIQNGARLDS